MKKYKVVQWATGGMGLPCLRTILARPELELVGLYVYSASKIGQDAGDVARSGTKTGVVATNRIEDILALDADVVVHCARVGGTYEHHDEDLIRILESGKNVISINGFSYPEYWGGERVERLNAACKKGGVSIMNAGLNPGFIGEQIAVVATGLCGKLESVHVIESASVETVPNYDYVFTTLGFGADPGTVNPNDPNWAVVAPMNGIYFEAIAAVAYRLGLKLDRVETDHKFLPASNDLVIRAGTIRKGMISHLGYQWYGIVNGERRISFSVRWYAERTYLEDPHPPLWSVEAVGYPSVKLKVECERHPNNPSKISAEQQGMGGSVVNSIPFVVNSVPGIVVRPMATPYSGGLESLI